MLFRSRSDNFGIALFSRLPIVESRIVETGGRASPGITEGRRGGVPTILAALDSGRGELRIVATHPPPPVGRSFARRRNRHLRELPRHTEGSTPVLLLGDLNTTPWNYHFRRLVRDTGLVDSSRGWGVQTTWPRGNPLLRVPIDHCLHSPEITIVRRAIGPAVGSEIEKTHV